MLDGVAGLLFELVRTVDVGYVVMFGGWRQMIGAVNKFDVLVQRAAAVVSPRELSPSAVCGTVGAAIETESGDIFVGVCVDTSSSLGFCAEHAAAAAMLTAGQNVVVRMVAVNRRHAVLAPCGQCREFISQLSPRNLDAEVLVTVTDVAYLRDLMPYRWPMN